MAKAELGWRRLTKGTLELMLAHSGVEALHGRCMPGHGRGRIRAAALHAWHNQEDVSYQLLAHADYQQQPFRQMECGSAEGRDVSCGGEGNRKPTDTTFYEAGCR